MMSQLNLIDLVANPTSSQEIIDLVEEKLKLQGTCPSYTRLSHAAIVSGISERFQKYAPLSDPAKRRLFLPYAVMTGNVDMIVKVSEFLTGIGLSYSDIVEYAILGQKDDPAVILLAYKVCGIPEDISSEKRQKMIRLTYQRLKPRILTWLETN